MAVGKYIMPVVMGESSKEIYLITNALDKDLDTFLLRQVRVRAPIPKDEKHINRLLDASYTGKYPVRITELEALDTRNMHDLDPQLAGLVYGYMTNVLPGAFKAPELNGWYILERPSDLTALKMARFSINLMEAEEKKRLIALLVNRSKSDATRLAKYR